MTSIQDWSKWNRMYGNPASQSAPPKNNEGKAFRASVQLAEKNGYFLNLDSDFLLNEFGPSKPIIPESQAERHKLTQMLKNLDTSKEEKDRMRRKDFLLIRYINLGSRHLRVLGPIEFCRNLRILVLSNNYLTQIDGLSHCKHLVKLDVHGNQLSQLPTLSMWANLRSLQVLYLHDNPIVKRSAVHGLTSCRSLVYLTLFDTPISLKKNYRHHLVNNIVSLKALDHYVIADEEIIEDVSFGSSRFSTFHPALRIRTLEDDATCKVLADGDKLLRDQLSQISQALKHCSPVVIVQRFVRGWLTRRRNGLRPSRFNTTVTQGPPPPPSRTSAMRQPPGPPQQQQQPPLPAPAADAAAATATAAAAHGETDKTQIDFDEYVKRLDDGEREPQPQQQLRVSLDRLAGGDTTLEALDRQSDELDWAIGDLSATTPVGKGPLGALTRYPSSPSPSAAAMLAGGQSPVGVAGGGRSSGGGVVSGKPRFGPVMPTVDEDEELPMGSFRLNSAQVRAALQMEYFSRFPRLNRGPIRHGVLFNYT